MDDETATRLEWKSFFGAGKARQKRLGTEDGKVAIKIIQLKMFQVSLHILVAATA